MSVTPDVALGSRASSAVVPGSGEAADRAARPRLLRIQDAAAEVGLTPRTIRYYEEHGLVTPCARSEGDYRLYDEANVERLRIIKSFRDDAGFSVAEVAELLGEEEASARARAAYQASSDPEERRRLVADGLARVERQVARLQGKVERLAAMLEEAEARRARLTERLAELDASGPGVPGGTP